jgi:hypothetical protein
MARTHKLLSLALSVQVTLVEKELRQKIKLEGSPNTFPAESTTFRAVTRCISVEFGLLFKENHRFYLQGRKTNQV